MFFEKNAHSNVSLLYNEYERTDQLWAKVRDIWQGYGL